MFLTFTANIWFYPVPVDFRKQLDGLTHLVADVLGKDPTSGELFIFRIKTRSLIIRFNELGEY